MPSVSIPAIGVTSLAATASAAAPYAALASAGIGAMGAIQQGNAQSAAAGYQSEIAKNNAKINAQNAEFQGAVGEVNAGNLQMKTRAQVGATKANQGASGITVGQGSGSDVLASERELGKLSAMQARSDAARKAYGFRTEEASDTAQSQLLKKQASYDKTAGYVNAGTTILGGVGSAALYSHLFATDPTGGLTNVANEDTQAASSSGASFMKEMYPQY